MSVKDFHMNKKEKYVVNFNDNKKYVLAETMMGPNSVRILEELLDKYPLQLGPNAKILDLGCGTGLTSLVIARETGSRVMQMIGRKRT